MRNRYIELLARYLAPLWPGVLALAGLVAAGVGFQLVGPQILRSFIDAAGAQRAPDLLWSLAVAYLAVELLQRATAFGAVFASGSVGGRAVNGLRADLLRHCLFLDMPFHKRHAPGELLERLIGDVGDLANFFSQFAIRVASSALLVLGILALLFREDWRVGAVLSGYAVLTFAALRAVHPLAVRRRAAARQASAAQSAFLEEHLGATEDIRANGAETHVLRRMTDLGRTLLLRQRAAQLVSEVTFVASNFLFAVGSALGLGLGAFLYTRGEATVGTSFLIVSYAGMLFAPLERIREQMQDLQNASAGIHRIDALLAERPAVADPEPGTRRVSLPQGPLAVAFDRVTFAYDDRVAVADGPSDDRAGVLHDVAFSVVPGNVLGVVGRTGSGKTTLTRLLFRLYDPTAGAVRIGGVDVRNVALWDLRRRVALVTQDVQLFQSTVRDNVAFFDPSVPDERIVAVLEDLGMGVWFRGLPQGLATPLGAGGHGLSAGEAQLLAFARAFLKDPGLIILDEASSRLDPATEHLLERATDRLLAGRTGIVIAHRLQTLRRVDDVLILENGRVAEYGRREALERDSSSRLAQLLRVGSGAVLVEEPPASAAPASSPSPNAEVPA